MPRPRLVIQDRDRGWRKVRAAIKSRLSRYVDVGVLESRDMRSDDIGNMELALIHELGLGVPERSVIRDTIDLNQTAYRIFIRKLAQQVVIGRITKKQALELIGLKIQADMRARVGSSELEELADSTKERKGSSAPLLDTGQYRSSIDYEVGP